MSRTGSAAEVLRKLVFIGLLAGGLVPLVRFGLPAPELEPTGILALGFALLTCFAVGELAVRVRLPAIAGYLVVGLALGPSMARLVSPWLDLGPLAGGVLDDGVVGQLHLLDTLALALIALTAGGGLEVVRLRRGLGAILGVLTGQVVTIGVAVLIFISFSLAALAAPMSDV